MCIRDRGYFLAQPAEGFPPLRDIAVATLRELARSPAPDVLPPVEYDEESGEFRTVMTRALALAEGARAQTATGDATSDFVDEHFRTIPGPGVQGKPTGTG